MKYIFSITLIILFYIIISNVVITKNLIPDEAIRIRVIANSNSDYDQKIKYEVKDLLENDMYSFFNNIYNIDEARDIITNNLEIVNNHINNYLNNIGYNQSFNLNFGYNYFPKKEFKGIKYKEGYYESVVVTLGSGEGNNWWCVLFPPLCLIEADEYDDIEYSSFIKEIINKYF